MKSVGHDNELSARQLPFHLFVEGWPGTHISLGHRANNCMGFRTAVLEGGDCISLPDVSARSTTESEQSGVDLLAKGNWLLNLFMGLQSNRMILQKRIYQELQCKDTTSASERP